MPKLFLEARPFVDAASDVFSKNTSNTITMVIIVVAVVSLGARLAQLFFELFRKEEESK